jgi:hypothetical protein
VQIQILDLDGSIPLQRGLVDRHRPAVIPASRWGPRIRLGCSFGRFRRFERSLPEVDEADGPRVTLFGSGDFHHVSLALLRRLTGPFNVLVIDNHPDWMRGLPFLHCGTWVYHAARLPQVRRVFHVGGDVDFDNCFRWLAPWRLLRGGKIVVLPGVRRFGRGGWHRVAHHPVRPRPDRPTGDGRLAELLAPWSAHLAACPLYISVDKDVLGAEEAVVNWDSGHLTLGEVREILDLFVRRARGRLAGMDLTGDWSAVRLRGLFRRVLHWTEHPALEVDAAAAAARNERTNLELLDAVWAAAA